MGRLLPNPLAPSGRRQLGGVLALGAAVLLAGACTQTHPVDPLGSPAAVASCSATTSLTAPADLPASLVPGLTLDVKSDETSFIHLATPVIPGVTVLTGRLRAIAGSDLSGYRQDLAASGDDIGELNLSWNLTGVSLRAIGVQVTTSRSVGAVTTGSTQVVWWDQVDHRLLEPQDLFTAQGWSELTARLTVDLCAGGPARTPLVTQALSRQPGQTRLAVAFAADGGAVVAISSMTPGSEPFKVVLGAAAVRGWLSAAGQAASAASVQPQSLPLVATPVQRSTQADRVAPRRAATKERVSKPASPPARKESRAQPKAVDCRKARCVALTFDDGPGPYTADLVRRLQKAHAPATFFMMGEHVDAFPDLTRTVARAGFEIGNHSYSHPDLTRLSESEVQHQLSRTSAAIQRATGRSPTLMRPPYGARNAEVDKAAAQVGLTEVLWDVDTLDWKHRNAKVVQKDALADAHRGSIVLLHDIHPTTVQAVPGLVIELRKRGYTLVTVSELLGSTRPGSRHFRAD
ncbi:MAG TPA: polysaccharide deacetylase family protein [Propionibacteriaceae bacterium]